MIANTLYLSKDIEKWGSGFRRITEVCAKADVKVKFEIRKNGFMVIFYRKNDEELIDLTGENKNAQENAQEIHKRHTRKVTEEAILKYCKESKSIKEIAEKFGYKNIRNFRERHINPLLAEEKLKMTIPEQPKNRNEKIY